MVGLCNDYLVVSDDDKICPTGENPLRRIYSVANIEEVKMRFRTDRGGLHGRFKAYFVFI